MVSLLKKNKCIVLAVLATLVVSTAMAVTPSPKRDFRGAWLSTVWAIDWPNHRDTTAEATKTQKVELRNILTNYEKCNINACYFQVRGMSDAMYNSKYEPWSQYLTGKRGLAPTYDPFQYLIEEAHARGIEVHAWINPYRYATSEENYGRLATDYSNTHPDWLINCGGIHILNPGLPAVREQIVNIVVDILEKYDVDGIVFDDYFYQDGMLDSYDDELYAKYNPDSLERGDWRRRQVNLMVQDVYNAIKSRKPWCRFGISPAGVAASSKSVADKYGITPCPAGSDWQYNQIYAEPVQWYVDKSVDYISPQVYWTIGSSADYAKITPWWYMVANHFGRHCYISQSLSGLSHTKTMPAKITERENASAATNFYADEISNQIIINHNSAKEGAPGTVFFSSKQIAKTGFIKTIVRDVYTRKAIVPVLTWFRPTEQQGLVSNLKRDGQTLTWDYAVAGQRYGVYAMPKDKRNDVEALTTTLYYQGMTYYPTYTLADSIAADYAVCVTVIDRYGNEYAPRFLDEALQEPITPQLIFPEDGAEILLPNYLQWEAMDDVMGYQLEIAYDMNFDDIIAVVPVDTNVFFTQPFMQINGDSVYYWRVSAQVANRESRYSEVRSFTGDLFSVTSPINGESEVSVTPTITWDYVMEDADYLVEIATSNTFKSSEIVFTKSTKETSVAVPENLLKYGTTHYVRVTVTTPYMTVTSASNMFVTADVVMVPPVITKPANGATIVDAVVQLQWQETPNNGFRLEWAKSASFPNRSKKIKSLDMGVYEYTLTELTEGTWYVRIATIQKDGTWTDYSEIVSFNFSPTTAIENVWGDTVKGQCYDLMGRPVKEPQSGQIIIQNGKLIYKQ